MEFVVRGPQPNGAGVSLDSDFVNDVMLRYLDGQTGGAAKTAGYSSLLAAEGALRFAMISESEAHAIVKQYIDDQCRDVPGGVAIIEKRTIQKPYGWIFFYNSNRYLETLSPLEALGGNGPIVVKRADGNLHQLGSGVPPDVSIAEFERAHGLK